MSKHTSFRTGGCADIFVKINNIQNLKYVLKFAKEYEMPLFILGNGSNICAISPFLLPDPIVTNTSFMDYDGNLYKIRQSEHEFTYRHSIFGDNKYVILESTLKLKKGKKEEIKKKMREYQSLRKF